MTLLAAYKSHGMPMLVGDAMCGFFDNEQFQPLMLRKKVYMITTNLAIGWTGSAFSALFVVSALFKEFETKPATSADLASLLTNVKFDDMVKMKVKIIGWIVDDQPRCFMWESDDPNKVKYGEHCYEGSGKEFWKTLVTSSMGKGGDPGWDGTFSREVGAVQETLGYCGEAFFREIGTTDWRESFGFAYEILIYANGRFFPLGDTAFVEWEYVWNSNTKSGVLKLGHFLSKLNFRGHYSVLQKSQHIDLKPQWCRNYVIRPLYEYEITEKLTFAIDLNADHYVHFLVCNIPEKRAQLRVPYVCGKTRQGDKIWLRSNDGKATFEVDNAQINRIFNPAIAQLR